MGVPTFSVEMAFGSNPGDPTYTWTDITEYVREVSYQRGRNNERATVEAGSGSLLLKDDERNFDPTYTSGPYYPDVKPLVPVRMQVLYGAPGVGIDANTVLMLHADGADASTTFTDASQYAHAMTAVGNAQIDTAQSKFGGASALFDGAGDYLSTPDSADWHFGAGNYTVDCWVRFASVATDQTLVSQWGAAGSRGWRFSFRVAGGLRIQATADGTSVLVDLNAAWTPVVNTWYHVAVVKSGTIVRLYLNGVKISVDGADAITYVNSTAALTVGMDIAGTQPLNGWIDEVRVSKGIARWTANFTPPTEPYTADTSVEYPCFQHYVERWPRARHGPNYAERQITTVDGFDWLGNQSVQATKATLTTTLGGNRDITYTADDPGDQGNGISVQYVTVARDPASSLVVSAIGPTIVVYAPGSKTANQVLAAVMADPNAKLLVNLDLAPGSNGTGIVTAMAQANLVGGQGSSRPAETIAERVDAMLDLAGWPAGLRDLETGNTTVGALTFSDNTEIRILDHIKDIAGPATENGLLFIDGAGQVRFLERHTTIATTSSQATFSDTPGVGEYGYQDSTPTLDRDLIINEATGSRDGGALMMARDADSQTYYGRRTVSLSSQASTDNEVQGAVQWIVYRFKDPFDRIDTITVMPGIDDDLWELLLGLELGDRVTVEEHPVGGGTNLSDFHIERIDVRIPTTVQAAEFTFGLRPVQAGLTQEIWFVLNSPTLGVLDTNKVAY